MKNKTIYDIVLNFKYICDKKRTGHNRFNYKRINI